MRAVDAPEVRAAVLARGNEHLDHLSVTAFFVGGLQTPLLPLLILLLLLRLFELEEVRGVDARPDRVRLPVPEALDVVSPERRACLSLVFGGGDGRNFLSLLERRRRGRREGPVVGERRSERLEVPQPGAPDAVGGEHPRPRGVRGDGDDALPRAMPRVERRDEATVRDAPKTHATVGVPYDQTLRRGFSG